MRINVTRGPDHRLVSDVTAHANDRVVADFCSGFDDRQRLNRNALAQLNAWIDDRAGMRYPGAKVIGFGANLSRICSNAFAGLERRICAALIGSAKSAGTKIADARVLRSRPMYFRSVKKLISPGVASPSDAAPVIFSVEAPTNSPPDSAASSLTVRITGVVKLLKRQGRAGSPPHAARRTGV